MAINVVKTVFILSDILSSPKHPPTLSNLTAARHDNEFNTMNQNLLDYFYDDIQLQSQQTHPSETKKE